jgi:hypothetical protein
MAKPKRRYHSLPLQQVHLDDPFWSPRQKVNRERSIAYQFAQLERVGIIEALDQKPRPLKIPLNPAWQGTHQMF